MIDSFFKTEIAYDNWTNKYQYDNEKPIETFERIAKTLASNEKNPEEWYDIFLNTLIKFDKKRNPLGIKCSPGGRITSNIGTKFNSATLINCFISGPVKNATITYTRENENFKNKIKMKTDDTPDDLVNIFLTIMEQAKTLASEGGYGINFDFIRPRGSLIKGTGIRHPGVISYMEVWDAVAECIVRGDNDGYVDTLKNNLTIEEQEKYFGAVKKMTRKGAMMGCLSIWHPDIEEFIRAKQESGKLTKFNMSIVVCDDFMKAVKNDKFWNLTWNNKIVKKVKARELYDLIMKSTYNRAEPGILFVDNMDKNNPIQYLGKCESTNPCFSKDMYLFTKNGCQTFEYYNKQNKKLNLLQDGRVSLLNNDNEVFVINLDKNNINYTISDSPVKLTQKNIDTLKITLKSHFMPIVSTYNHRFMTSDGEKKAKDLCVGDKVLYTLQDYPTFKDDELDELAFLLGLIDGDGCVVNECGEKYIVSFDLWNNDINIMKNKIINIIDKLYNTYGNYISEKRNRKISPYYITTLKNKIRISSSFIYRLLEEKFKWEKRKKCIPSIFFKKSRKLKYAKNYIAGLFFADGHVTKHKPSIRISQSDKLYLEQIGVLLSSIGIKSSILKRRNVGKRKLPNGKGGYNEYNCKTNYELIIYISEFNFFYRIISDMFKNHKTDRIYLNIKTRSKRKKYMTVKNIEPDNNQDVYCIKEPQHKNIVVNGCSVARCGEIPGNPIMTTVCLLGSINLTQYVEINKDKNSYFDFEKYKKDIKIFTRMLDNVCDLSNLPLPAYEWAVKNLRQFGMGVNGLGSTLLMLGIPYNSPEAVKFTKTVTQLKENLTIQSSSLLAKEKGSFTLFDYEKFSNTTYFKSDRITDETKKLIKKHGLRNAKTTTNPPLGNSSLFCDNVSNSSEPIFSLETERKVICDWPEGLNIDNVKTILIEKKKKDFVYWDGEYNNKKYYYEPHNRGLCELYILRDYGYQWIIDNFPEKKKEDFVITVKDLDIEDHLNIQEVLQYYCNQSVSKTINLPYKYSFEKFKELYFNAWKRGLIGVTTYRAGSMESVMESLEKAEKKKEIIKKGVTLPTEFINGNTMTIKKEGMKFYIHFSYIPDDRELKYPIALWINTNNVGEVVTCNRGCKSLAKLAIECGIALKIVEDTWDKCLGDTPHNRLGRMVSLCLRHNIPREDILVALAGIDGDNISTLLSAVRKFLAETIEDGTVLVGIKCPSCGSDDLIMEAGCFKCNDCSYCGCGA